ncbi:MAG: transcription termination factor NusA [Planctomycetaceae bacterium]|nr:transcription termination factor NusA [Planctomycetaceae bacterium]
MNGADVLRFVDALHRDRNIDKSIVIEALEQAVLSAAKKHYGEDFEVTVAIDQLTGKPTVLCDGKDIEPDMLGEILGRISSQTAKQVLMQRIREAERDSIFDEYEDLKGQLVTGTITRFEGGSALVTLSKIDGFLPKSEQIPGESHRIGERIRAVVIEVRKAGSRVKIILSRTHPDLVLELFKTEIPEVAEGIIEVRSLAREAGYRSKVAVSCSDTKIDCVGACVGVRGARIKNIVDELAGERIDIVRWNDSLQVLVPNAMQPSEVEDVILCPMLGRVIVLVREDQLSLAIGKRGQNVRLASKLVGWDIEVMTRDELNEQLEKSVAAFSQVPHITEELAESLVSQGFFSFYDLSVIEPDQLQEMSGCTAEQIEEVVAYADVESDKQEIEDNRRKAELKLQREIDARAAAAPPKADAPVIEHAPPPEAEASAVTVDEVVAESSVAAESPSPVAETEQPISAELETPAQVAE